MGRPRSPDSSPPAPDGAARKRRGKRRRTHAEAPRERADEDVVRFRFEEDDEPHEHQVEPVRYPIALNPAHIDADAAKVVQRLVRNGYEAYLVGGCVRDLLLDASPKDFDVATSARPDDVRTLFRNSRVIGRRFRLVHVLYGGGKIIETATFRKNPTPDDKVSDDLLIRDDNVFGEAFEDAARRDFTINGLFYDLERGEVLDWVGGMPDVQARMVRTIGDPVVRFLEDPVRILRAIKFCARLDLGILPEVYDAMVSCRGSLAMAARPRLFEEVLRLMRGGASHRSVWLMWETGVLDVLLPELSSYVSDTQDEQGSTWALFSAVDRETKRRGQPFDDIVLWTVLLLDPMLEACQGATDRVETAFEFLEPVIDRLSMPRRIADAVRRIVAMMPRLESGRPGRFSRTPLYELAQEVAFLVRDARGVPGERRESPVKARAPEGTRQRAASKARRSS